MIDKIYIDEGPRVCKSNFHVSANTFMIFGLKKPSSINTIGRLIALSRMQNARTDLDWSSRKLHYSVIGVNFVKPSYQLYRMHAGFAPLSAVKSSEKKD